jgi:hypothetical protein
MGRWRWVREWFVRHGYDIIIAMNSRLQNLIERIGLLGENDQAELANHLAEIETRPGRAYHATPEELVAIDDADRRGTANDGAVTAAFQAFRRV